MKYLKILARTTLVSFALSIAVSASAAKGDEERIRQARSNFQRLLQANPDETISAVLYFSNDMTLEEVRASIAKSELNVKAFLHGNASLGGGFVVPADMDLDQAITRYKLVSAASLKNRIEIEQEMARTEGDPVARQAMIEHLRDARQAESDLNNRGVRVIGMEVRGKVTEIDKFYNSNTYVKVIENKQSGKGRPAIYP